MSATKYVRVVVKIQDRFWITDEQYRKLKSGDPKYMKDVFLYEESIGIPSHAFVSVEEVHLEDDNESKPSP